MAPSTFAVRNIVVACAFLLIAVHLMTPAEARYLPTRGQDDRLERLRELLKDLLEGELERSGAQGGQFDKRVFFKRDIEAVAAAPHQEHVAPVH